MKISIVGAGALGSYIGGRLAANGEEVTLVARGEHLRAIRTDGLRIEGVHGNFFVKPVAATDNAGDIGIVDVVVLSTKTYDVEGAAASLGPMLGEHSLVLPVLNGVEHVALLRDVVGQSRLIGGVAYIFSCNGSVVRLGRRFGIKTPVNDVIYVALKQHGAVQKA